MMEWQQKEIKKQQQLKQYTHRTVYQRADKRPIHTQENKREMCDQKTKLNKVKKKTNNNKELTIRMYSMVYAIKES